jgi:hypothetical protein
MKGEAFDDREFYSQNEVTLKHEQERNDLIAIGRFAERDLFTEETRPYDLTRERIPYRVIMDNRWHVSDRKVLLQELGRRTGMSRVAYKIMKVSYSSCTTLSYTERNLGRHREDIEKTSFFWERE